MTPQTAITKLLKDSSYGQIGDELGFSRQYIFQVHKGDRPASKRLMRALGLEKVTTYKRRKRK